MSKREATRKDYEKHLLRMIKKFAPLLLLQRHTFEIRRGVDNEGSYFECVSNYPYLNARIHYSDKSFEDWNKGKDIVPYLVHELCHPVTEPLYVKGVQRYVTKDEINDERERLTDLICNIVLKTIKWPNI